MPHTSRDGPESFTQSPLQHLGRQARRDHRAATGTSHPGRLVPSEVRQEVADVLVDLEHRAAGEAAAQDVEPSAGTVEA